MKKLGRIIGACMFLFWWLSAGQLHAQNTEFDLQLEVNPELTSTQIADLSKTATGERVPGQRLFTLHIFNNGGERADDLYLDLSFSAEEEGVLWEVYQRSNFPFFMRQGRTLFATNNDIATNNIKGLPGNVDLEFDGRVTENGTRIINRLRNNAGSFPTEYTIEAGLYKDNNRQNGGTRLAHTSVTIGLTFSDGPGNSQRANNRGNSRRGVQQGGNALVLLSPGDHVNSRPPASISNPYPEFRWEGPQNESYRLVIVERQPRQNPESLIQNALDTSPGRTGESVRLLDFENADVLVDGNSFQYPSSGVAPLQNGRQYFWQVFTEGGEEAASEIWSFRLTGGGGVSSATASNGRNMKIEDEELREVLSGLLGMNIVRELERGNYELLDIELNGQQYSGDLAVEELQKLIEKIREGNTKINKVQRP